MNYPDYSVVIVTFNGKKVLGPSLDALRVSKPKPAEIFVVDNASSDGTVEYLKEQYPEVKVLSSGGNIGFGKGNNLGIAQVTSPYVMLVNNDLKVEPDCAAHLLTSLEKNPKVAVADPLIFRGWDKSVTTDIYSFGSRIDTAGFTLNVDMLPDDAPTSNCFSGACCMLRTELAQKYPFEKRFFLYYEEPELMMRLAKLGFTTERVPEAKAWHLENYSSPGKAASALSFRQFYAIQNRWFSLGKHYPMRLMLAAKFYNILHLGYFLLYFAKNKQYKYLSLAWRAPWSFLMGMTHRGGQKISNPTWWTMLYPTSLGSMMNSKKLVIKD